MKAFPKLLKYECLNILRNRWIYVFAFLSACLSFAFLRISGDPAKAVLALSHVLGPLVPLVSVLFTTVYWYYSERFTGLLLTQPLRRRELFLARWSAILLLLGGCFAGGVSVPFLLLTSWDPGILLLLGSSLFLLLVFVTLGLWIATAVVDRMKGIGLALGLWLYFSLVHDGMLLLILLALREYPLDLVSAVLGALNPIGLARVALLLHYDASMLLSHTGMLVRNILIHWQGMALGAVVALAWMAIPALLACRQFDRRDF